MKRIILKSSYQVLFCFILVLVLSSCTTDKNEDTEIPVLFSIADTIAKAEGKSLLSNNIVVDDDNPSMIISMREMEWDRKYFINTKTSWATGSNVVSWTTGDPIGIYMRSSSGGSNYYDRNNAQYNVATGGSSSAKLNAISSPLSFPDLTNNVQFFAYYPYSVSAGNSLSVNYTLPANQSTQSSLRTADIMCSNSPIKNGASPNVSLNFNHKMVLLSFQIHTTFFPAQLKQVTVSGQSVTNTGVLNLSTGNVTPNTATFSAYAIKDQYIDGDTYAYVDIIINPCTIMNNGDLSKLKVTLSFSNFITHSTRLLTSGPLAGGTRYVYDLEVLFAI